MPGGGGGTTTTQTKADPWAGIQPGLQRAANDATSLYNRGLLNYSYYPGSTVVPFSPETGTALNMKTQRAIEGSPITNTAKDYERGLLSGTYLNSNPYLDKMFNNAADAVTARVNSAFAGGGRSGGGINQQVLTRELGKTAADVYGGNYESERQRQQQGLLFAPQLANQDYFDIDQLADVGAAREGIEGQQLQENIDRFNYNQNAPAENIRNFVGLLNGAGGSYPTSTATTPYYKNRASTALGGAALGAGLLGPMGLGLTTTPIGLGVGAGLGLLGGYF